MTTIRCFLSFFFFFFFGELMEKQNNTLDKLQTKEECPAHMEIPLCMIESGFLTHPTDPTKRSCINN